MDVNVGDIFVRQAQRVEVLAVCGQVIFLGFRNAQNKLRVFPPYMLLDQLLDEGWQKAAPIDPSIRMVGLADETLN